MSSVQCPEKVRTEGGQITTANKLILFHDNVVNDFVTYNLEITAL